MNRPFDARRYQRLLEGLEITVKKLSAVKQDNPTVRIDSEFFQRHFLANVELIEQYPLGYLHLDSAIKKLAGGATPLGAQYPESGIPFLRVQNIMQNYLDEGDLVFISPKDDATLSRSRLQRDDVLLTITGVSYGKSAVVTPEFVNSNINQHSVRMALKSQSLRPLFLSTFLNARPGKWQSDQNITGVTRPALDYQAIRRFRIPQASDEMQEAVEQCVKHAQEALRNSKQLAQAAETILVEALGLGDWQPPRPLSYTRSASQAFETGRLDAEYYEPAYVDLRAHIGAMGGARLGSLVAEKIRRGTSPEYVESGDLPVINSQHVGKDRIVLEETRTTQKKLVAQGNTARTGLVRQWDVLLNSTGRITIGRCQCVLDSIEAVVDNHVSIIRPKPGLDPVYLASFLNSRFGLMQTEQSQTGSSGQIELRPELVEDFEIWLAPADVQSEVREQALAAHIARRRARELLSAAQRAVEIAIEQDEAAALAYLKGIG